MDLSYLFFSGVKVSVLALEEGAWFLAFGYIETKPNVYSYTVKVITFWHSF